MKQTEKSMPAICGEKENLVLSHKVKTGNEDENLVLSHKVESRINVENLDICRQIRTGIPAEIGQKEQIIHHFMSEMTYRPNMISVYIAAARMQNFNGNLRCCNKWVEECFGITDYCVRSDYNRVGNMLMMMSDTDFITVLMYLDFNKNRALAGFREKDRLSAFLDRCPNIVNMTTEQVWKAVTATLGTARAKRKHDTQPDLLAGMETFRYLEADDQHVYDAAAKLKPRQAYQIIVGGMLYIDCGLISWTKHHGPMPAEDKQDLLLKMNYLMKELQDTPEA